MTDRPPTQPNSPPPGPQQRYLLRLYVSGTTARSTRAITIMREICEKHLDGRYDLEVIDIYQDPQGTKADQVVAVPTVVKLLPQPLRRLIGDLSNRERVLSGLDIILRSADTT